MLERGMHPHDDLAAYALDALNLAEHGAVEAHLAECGACRAELDAHRETLARMAGPGEEPPASVWAGVAGQLTQPDAPPTLPGAPTAGSGLADLGGRRAQREHGEGPAGRERREGPAHRRRRGRGRSLVERAGWLVAAAAVVVIAGLGVLLARRIGEQTRTVADLAAAAAEAPDATVVPLLGDNGTQVARVVLADTGTTSYVIFDNLTPLPPGRAYQLWDTRPAAGPISLGVLGDGHTPAIAIAAPANPGTLALSDEPATGSPQPTGPIIATGQPT